MEPYDDEMPELTPALSQRIAEEIAAKIADFEGSMSQFLSRFNSYANIWKTLKPEERNAGGMSNTRTSETFRATETLATMIHRMWHSHDPNFDIHPATGFTNEQQLKAAGTIIRRQQEWLRYPRKTLSAVRTATLFGTVVVEEPWKGLPFGSVSPFMEGTDFAPRSLLQVGFERTTTDIEEADWIYFLDLLTKARLMKMVRGDSAGYVWIPENVQAALDDTGKKENLNEKVLARLTRAGYNFEGQFAVPLEFCNYTGSLDALDDGEEYCVSLVNRRHVVRFHKPSRSSLRRIRVGRFIDFELEPYGHGVGSIGARIQQQLDSNRNRTSDGITFSQYHQFLVSRYSGINPKDFKIKPWHIIPGDDIGEGALRELRISADGLQWGLKLEELLKEDFRTSTAASDNLQALVTEATATESSLAQSEAVRRVSVLAEVMADDLLKPHLYRMHQDNFDFLDEPIWVRLTGQDKPLRFDPRNIKFGLPEFLDFEMKLTTDRDFRPNRSKRVMELLNLLMSARNAQIQGINVLPLIREQVRMNQIDPDEVVPPGTDPTLMIPQSAQAAGVQPEQVSSELPATPEDGAQIAAEGGTPVSQGNQGGVNVPLISSTGESLNGR